MKRIINALNIAIGEILNNKVRSLLSVFAVSIGVLVFLFVFSALNYAKNEKAKQLAVAGENVFIINMFNENYSNLKMKDIEEIEQKFPELNFVAPRSDLTAETAVWNNKYYDTKLLGITPNQTKFDWVYNNLKGRFISWDDIKSRNKVAVFVKNPVRNKGKINEYDIFNKKREKAMEWRGNQDPIGEKIKIRNDIYTVVGTIEAPLYSDDNRVIKYETDFFIPLSAYADSFYNNYLMITASLKDKRTFPNIKKKILRFLENKHKNTKDNRDTLIHTYEDMIANRLKNMNESIKLISILGLIALISGGIGIMNVILATIFARIKEIGTRRALGASKGDIFMQFTAESVTLSLLGACMGLIFSHFLFDSIKEIIKLKTEFNWLVVVLAFGMAMITGFIFSLYPALKAANMDPVEALKIE